MSARESSHASHIQRVQYKVNHLSWYSTFDSEGVVTAKVLSGCSVKYS